MRNLAVIGLLSTLLGACQGSGPPATSSGRWAGTLGEGADTIGFLIDVEELGAELLAEADIPAQGIRDLPLAAEARGDSLFFRLGGGQNAPAWRGRRTGKGAEFTGVFTQDGEQSPLVLRRVAESDLSAELRALAAISPESLRVANLSPDSRELRDEFNANRDRIRLVLLLSPS